MGDHGRFKHKSQGHGKRNPGRELIRRRPIKAKGPKTKERRVKWDGAREFKPEHDGFITEVEAKVAKRPKDKRLRDMLARTAASSRGRQGAGRANYVGYYLDDRPGSSHPGRTRYSEIGVSNPDGTILAEYRGTATPANAQQAQPGPLFIVLARWTSTPHRNS